MMLKPIILKALRRSQGKTMDEVAEIVAEYIDIATDLGQVLDQTPKPAKPLIITDTVINTSMVINRAVIEEAPPARIMAGKENHQYRTVDDIAKALNAAAPPTITVQPEGFDKPLVLVRQIVTPPNPDMGFVKLTYTPHGSDEGALVIFTTGEVDLDIEGKLSEIVDQAGKIFSAEPRRVSPRPPQVMSESSGTRADADGADSMDMNTMQSFRTDRATWGKYAKE